MKFNESVITSMPYEQVNKIVYQSTSRHKVADKVIIEQPLQITLSWYDELSQIQSQVFTITMRTPGNDQALILGLLLSEGIIQNLNDVEMLAADKNQEDVSELNKNNLWEVTLICGVVPKISSIERYQVTYSSCGLCGATSLKALELKEPPTLCQQKYWLKVNDVYLMPKLMREHQQAFNDTGGVHAAALFDSAGRLLNCYEDIGRHNAVDKVFGDLLQRSQEQSYLKQRKQLIAVVSGRVSFEIVQKAVMAGIAVLIAVGAPSDLAIKAAKRFDLTLIGFVCDHTFNLYYGQWRLEQTASQDSLEE